MTALALDLVIRALAVLVVAAAAHLLCRRASASVRAGIWTAALAGLLVLPAMSRMLPAWRIEVLQPVAAPLVVDSIRSDTAPRVVMRPAAPLMSVRSTPDMSQASVDRASVAPAQPPRAFPWWTLLTLWIGVAAMLLVRVAVSHVRLSRIARQSAPAADPELDVEIQRACRRLGVGRDVSWRATDDVSVPAVTGFRHVRLLLPADAGSWPLDLKRSVVAHELAHVARWDLAGHAIGQAACAVYWFVPFVWLGARRAAALREQACDDAVLRSGVPASTYASALIRLAGQAGVAPLTAAALPMASPSHIQERVMAILDPSIRRRAVTLRAGVALIVASTGVVAVAAAAEPGHRVRPAGVDAVAPAVGGEVTAVAPAPRQSQTVSPKPASPGRQAAASKASQLCGGDLESSSRSIHEDNGTRTWTIKVKGQRCTVDFRLDGKVEFNEAFTDITSISSGGFLRLDVTDNGVRHEIELKPKNGSLERLWRVDGREKPYDDEAKAWFAAFLIEIDRLTGVGVDHRLPRLLRQGGVNAVLDETALMPSDYVRSVYYDKLAAATPLSAADVTRMIQQATSLKTSDYYATELLKSVGKSSGGDPAVRTAMFGLVASLESDYYMSESAKIVVGRGPATARDMDVLVAMMPRIKSDYYKSEVIGQILKVGVDGKATTLIEAASAIREDFYLSDSLAALMSKLTLSESDLLTVVARAKRMSSDYYASEVLRRVGTHKAATAQVRQAVADAANGLSNYYRDEVRRAAGIKG